MYGAKRCLVRSFFESGKLFPESYFDAAVNSEGANELTPAAPA
jgi:hypothetical protein